MKYNLPTNWLLKHSGNMFAIILSTMIYQQIMYDTLVYLFFSICVYTVIALLNNCPMHGEFPSDVWLKIIAREKIIFKGEINVFSTKSFENYDYNFSLNILQMK